MPGCGDGSVSKLLSVKAWELKMEPQTHILKNLDMINSTCLEASVGDAQSLDEFQANKKYCIQKDKSRWTAPEDQQSRVSSALLMCMYIYVLSLTHIPVHLPTYKHIYTCLHACTHSEGENNLGLRPSCAKVLHEVPSSVLTISVCCWDQFESIHRESFSILKFYIGLKSAEPTPPGRNLVSASDLEHIIYFKQNTAVHR